MDCEGGGGTEANAEVLLELNDDDLSLLLAGIRPQIHHQRSIFLNYIINYHI